MAPLQNRLESAPSTAPSCLRCKKATDILVTRRSNRTGNAGRLYSKCIPCEIFHCFMDERGNDPTNPICHCGESSKRQVSKEAKGRRVHYVCRLGACRYYAVHGMAGGEQLSLTEDLVSSFSRLFLI